MPIQRKYHIEYLDGRIEEAIGEIYTLYIKEAGRRYFFDKYINGLPPNWLKRFNEYFAINLGNKNQALKFIEEKGGKMADFKRYWILDNAPEITKKYHLIRSEDDPPSKRGKKMFEKF